MNHATIAGAIAAGVADRIVPELCHRTLTDISERRRALVAVRHPLGFICLPVQREGEYGVCVHVWTAEVPTVHSTTSDVHAHSWDLISFVLYGRVRNAVWQVVDDAVDPTHRVFEIRSLGEVDEVVATARLVRCTERMRLVAGAGETYRLRAGDFHSTAIESWPEAATVALGRVQPAMDLSLGPLDTATHRVARQRCDPDETARAAEVVIRRLDTAAIARER